jgi:hypothetical protein
VSVVPFARAVSVLPWCQTDSCYVTSLRSCAVQKTNASLYLLLLQFYTHLHPVFSLKLHGAMPPCIHASSDYLPNRKHVFTCLYLQTDSGLPLLLRIRLHAVFSSRWPRFYPTLGHVGILVGKAALGQVFSQVRRLVLPNLIPPTAPHLSSSIIQSWYSTPSGADVQIGLSLTPPQEIKKIFRAVWCSRLVLGT